MEPTTRGMGPVLVRRSLLARVDVGLLGGFVDSVESLFLRRSTSGWPVSPLALPLVRYYRPSIFCTADAT
jgi:hypothetical protein